MSRPTAIAIAAHPDDIELKMAGALLLLRSAGWNIHYFNLCSGNGGSLEHGGDETAAIRAQEARQAAALLGAIWHPPIARDLELVYHPSLLRKVAAVIRRVQASIVLTHPFEDYMEDHTIAARLATTSAFAHGIPNFQTDPPEPAYPGNVAVYHCMPHGARTRLRRNVAPGAWVDTTTVHETARQALAEHRSQAGWLDASQGTSSYLAEMDAHSEEMGRASGKFRLAEGWTRHLHLGFSTVDTDPLAEVLGDRYLLNASFEDSLDQPTLP